MALRHVSQRAFRAGEDPKKRADFWLISPPFLSSGAWHRATVTQGRYGLTPFSVVGLQERRSFDRKRRFLADIAFLYLGRCLAPVAGGFTFGEGICGWHFYKEILLMVCI